MPRFSLTDPYQHRILFMRASHQSTTWKRYTSFYKDIQNKKNSNALVQRLYFWAFKKDISISVTNSFIWETCISFYWKNLLDSHFLLTLSLWLLCKCFLVWVHETFNKHYNLVSMNKDFRCGKYPNMIMSWQANFFTSINSNLDS